MFSNMLKLYRINAPKWYEKIPEELREWSKEAKSVAGLVKSDATKKTIELFPYLCGEPKVHLHGVNLQVDMKRDQSPILQPHPSQTY